MDWYGTKLKIVLTAGRKCDVRMNMELNEDERRRHENCTEGRIEICSAPPITLTLLILSSRGLNCSHLRKNGSFFWAHTLYGNA